MTLVLPAQTFGKGPDRKGPKGHSQVAGRSSDGSANRGDPGRRAPADGSDEPDRRKMPDRSLAGRVVLVAVRRPGRAFGSARRLVRFFGTGGSKGTTLGKVPYPERKPSGGRIGEGVRTCPSGHDAKTASAHLTPFPCLSMIADGNGANPPWRVCPVVCVSDAVPRLCTCEASDTRNRPLDQPHMGVCVFVTAKSGVLHMDVAELPRGLPTRKRPGRGAGPPKIMHAAIRSAAGRGRDSPACGRSGTPVR